MEFISKNNMKIKDKWLVYNIDSNNRLILADLYKMNELGNININVKDIVLKNMDIFTHNCVIYYII
jgi:mRNA-degrading endonuclease HigB of HigAB toxin-antitoxin module